MTKVFYNPNKENQIMGMSDGDSSMGFPFVETDEVYHELGHLRVELVEGKAVLIENDNK
jgi:hypothetical protein